MNYIPRFAHSQTCSIILCVCVRAPGRAGVCACVGGSRLFRLSCQLVHCTLLVCPQISHLVQRRQSDLIADGWPQPLQRLGKYMLLQGRFDQTVNDGCVACTAVVFAGKTGNVFLLQYQQNRERGRERETSSLRYIVEIQ